MLALLTERIASDEKNLEGYVIDGYPRSEEQLKNFTDKVESAVLLQVALRLSAYCV